MRRTPNFDVLRRYDGPSGLVFIGNHKLGWGTRKRSNWTFWLPERVKRMIIAAWNPLACMVWGHSHLCQGSPDELPVCCDCGRPVVPGEGDSVIKEYEI